MAPSKTKFFILMAEPSREFELIDTCANKTQVQDVLDELVSNDEDDDDGMKYRVIEGVEHKITIIKKSVTVKIGS